MARRKQDTLVLFPDVYMSTEKLTDAQFGALMRAAFGYRFYGEVYDGDDFAVELMFGVLKTQLDRYREVCATNKANGILACNTESDAMAEENTQGTPECTEMQRNAPECTEMQRNAPECTEMERNTPHTHTHNHTRNHNHSHNHNQNHTRTPNLHVDKNGNPTVVAIDAYCQEQRLTYVSAVDFWSYFDQRGWVGDDGKPIQDWKSLLHTWDELKKIEQAYDSII